MEQALTSRVSSLREARGLTLSNLADRVGISRPYMSQIEHGVRRPSLTVAGKIAAALGCTVDEVFGDRLNG